ncbi:MAG: hypothetical protein ACHQ0Y_14345 [Thermodesulfovibrionales bacterium]
MNTSLRRHPLPKVIGPALFWNSHRLGIEGRWKALSSPLHRTLFESDQGIVEWHCYQPQSEVSIQISPNTSILGYGYAEHLLMTIKPWELPIEELRWGRFVSKRDSLVWIDWRGQSPQSLVFYNGVQIGHASVGDRNIVLDEGKTSLSFEESIVLREGFLFSNVLHMIRVFRKILPARFLQTYECKWRSRGILRSGQFISSTGWVIHEVVKFG